ncbi:class I SAM-dependent methyltransferase [Pseudonocardia sp. RS11V-5]|uniref:class I SAM-dependent methyltransferase n=1 Tax=Pseudonocardia terrae TaxID=2905831 RepID=UPI001E2EE1FE|nr:class I SAM-dependent methyltransferase [Pseudonocardia terrae]MCE3553468.1 class I SAM-dependent methyltransferase [Pseudonocardia terrae]
MRAVCCRFCRGADGEVVLDLGNVPACEYFPPAADPGPDPLFPLRLWLCGTCGLAQLADDADLPDQPEGVEPSALVEQRLDAIRALDAFGLLAPDSIFTEGTSPHGGSWGPALKSRGLRRADPTETADLVVDGCFGLMHATDQRAALEALVARLAPSGSLILQFHTLGAVLRADQWNAVRLGHYAYYSVPALMTMLGKLGLTVTNVRTFPLYGARHLDGTVLLVARRGGSPDESTKAALDDELSAGVTKPDALRALQRSVEMSTSRLRSMLAEATRTGLTVYGYSAASRAVALLYLAGAGVGLTAIADASGAKHRCRMPGTRIPIVPPEHLVAAAPERVLLFVPDLLPEVRRSLPTVEETGKWIVCE